MTAVSVTVAAAALVVALLAWRASERTVKVQWLAQKEDRLASLFAALESLKGPAAHYVDHREEERADEVEAEKERKRAEAAKRAAEEARTRAKGVRSASDLLRASFLEQESIRSFMTSPAARITPGLFPPPWSRSATREGVNRARAALVMTINLPPTRVDAAHSVLDRLGGDPHPSDVADLHELVDEIGRLLQDQHDQAVKLVTPRRWRAAGVAIGRRLSPKPVVHWARDRVRRRSK